MDDDQLIAAIAAGDDTALRALFSRHAPWLAARLRSALPAPDVEDVLQETFLAVWRGAGSYRPRGTAGGWLWGVARRQAALFLRRRGPAELALPAIIQADGRQDVDPAEAALARAASRSTGPGRRRQTSAATPIHARERSTSDGSATWLASCSMPLSVIVHLLPSDCCAARPAAVAGPGGRGS